MLKSLTVWITTNLKILREIGILDPLACLLISQEEGQVVWYSHLLKYFPQFVVIHTVKGFGIVNKAEIDVFLELLLFQ